MSAFGWLYISVVTLPSVCIYPQNCSHAGQDVDCAVSMMKEKGYINDQEYASWFVRQRSQFKPKSSPMIKAELFAVSAVMLFSCT